MKRSYLLICAMVPGAFIAQVLSPLSLTGFNLDAIAENTTSATHTGGAIDGSNYVMYSAAYGTVYSTGTGLPNNGVVSSSTRTYQLAPYNQNNTLFVTAGQTDSLSLVTPGTYAAIGMLAFATEGAGSMNLTLRFTDNTTQVFTGQTIPDWFGTGSAILSGFDRCNRTSGTPNFNTTQPKMFSLDLPVICSNRNKQVTTIIVQNTGTNARLCVMALSGAAMPVYNVSVSPVTCSGGTNGSASITPAGGFPPFSYTVSATPFQYSGTPGNLPVGIYSYTVQDVAACPVTNTFAVTQSLVAQPNLSVQASSSVICAGATITLTANGAATYTWDPNTNGPIKVSQPATGTTFTVAGLTFQNCLRTGSISITVNQLPQVSFTAGVPPLCNTDAMFSLSGSPQGGLYSGPGVLGNSYDPSVAGAGTHVVIYNYTDQNGCSGSDSVAVSVYSLAPPVVSSGSAVCMNTTPFQVAVSPQGGLFSGAGVSSNGFITTTLAGVFPFSYSISDGPCVATTASAFTVLALPSLTLSISKIEYCVNGSQGVLIASPTGGQFTGKGVANFLFSPSTAGIGTHTLSYTYTNTSKCANTAYVTVKVYDCSALPEIEQADFSLFPNPNEGRFTVVSMERQTLFLFDALGRMLLEFEVGAKLTAEVNVPSVVPGVYFLSNRDGTVRKKVLIR